mgnify:CR=1 FL=1
MKVVDRFAAQGDFVIIRIDDIPPDVEVVERNKDGFYVVAHSETGQLLVSPRSVGSGCSLLHRRVAGAGHARGEECRRALGALSLLRRLFAPAGDLSDP